MASDNGSEMSVDEWEAAWSAELDRRVQEIRQSKVELVDGKEALARVRASIEARRR